MSYNLTGKVHALVCPGFQAPIRNGLIKVYRAKPLLTDSNANFMVLSGTEVSKKKDRLLGEAKINESGQYEVKLAQNYQGSGLEIDLVLFSQQSNASSNDQKSSQQVHFGGIIPDWSNGKTAYYDHVMSNKEFCGLLEILGLWVIAGTVLGPNCKEPCPHALVKAMDKDCIQDDKLGEGITDSFGRFLIYYTEADFTPTILSGIRHERGRAPDVYFKVEGLESGFVMLEEPRARAKQKDRCNVERCFCVKLCVKEKDPDSPCKVKFFRVGRYDISPLALGQDRIDPSSGLALDREGDLAFCKTVKFKGKLPQRGTSDRYEYRFLYRNLTKGEGIADRKPIKGNMIPDGCRIGERATFSSIPRIFGRRTSKKKIEYVYITGAETSDSINKIPVSAEGWIQAPNWPNFYQYNDNLLCFDTTKVHFPGIDLNNSPTLPIPPPSSETFQAGTDTTADPRFTPPISHVFEVTMEMRKVGSDRICRTILEKMQIDNSHYDFTLHPYWPGSRGIVEPRLNVNMLDICELNPVADLVNNCGGGTGCNKLKSGFRIKYTAFHPHLRSANLRLEGPGATFSQDVLANPSGTVICPDTLKNCAYVLWLTTYLNLTTGDGLIHSHLSDHISFCAMGPTP